MDGPYPRCAAIRYHFIASSASRLETRKPRLWSAMGSRPAAARRNHASASAGSRSESSAARLLIAVALPSSPARRHQCSASSRSPLLKTRPPSVDIAAASPASAALRVAASKSGSAMALIELSGGRLSRPRAHVERDVSPAATGPDRAAALSDPTRDTATEPTRKRKPYGPPVHIAGVSR